MKLLVFTQKVDATDTNLGFFHAWLEEFAQQCESLIVVCLEKGEHDLPGNVQVYSLGKEQGKSRFHYIVNFYKLIWTYRKMYESVFVHMNPEYVVMGSLLWKMLGKKVSLWYTHKSVDMKLRLAEKLTQIIFTASEKSFRLQSNKIIVSGHGIDTKHFSIDASAQTRKTLLHVGRISKSKQIDKLVHILQEVQQTIPDAKLTLVGEAITKEDKTYQEKVKQKNVAGVEWLGGKQHQDLPELFQAAGVYINMSLTGSLDKTILEAMACGTPVITTNVGILGAIGDAQDDIYVSAKDAQAPVQRALQMLQLPTDKRLILGKKLQKIVTEQHSLSGLIRGIIQSLRSA